MWPLLGIIGAIAGLIFYKRVTNNASETPQNLPHTDYGMDSESKKLYYDAILHESDPMKLANLAASMENAGYPIASRALAQKAIQIQANLDYLKQTHGQV